MSLSDLKLPTPKNTAQDVTGFLRSPSSNAQINNERFDLLVKNVMREPFNKLADWIDGINGRDYITKQGTSGIWTYRKWNSGIAECWGIISITNASTTAWGSIFAYDYTTPTDLPITFDEVNSVNATVQYGTGLFAAAIGSIQHSTTQIVRITVIRGTAASNANFNISVEVKGKWK